MVKSEPHQEHLISQSSVSCVLAYLLSRLRVFKSSVSRSSSFMLGTKKLSRLQETLFLIYNRPNSPGVIVQNCLL